MDSTEFPSDPESIDLEDANLGIPSLEEAKVVIALDFGTTFSGFAWALMSKPKEVHKFYSWPQMGPTGGYHYCKTPTNLWYTPGVYPDTLELQDWGYSAHFSYYQALQSRTSKRKRNYECISSNAAENIYTTEIGEFITQLKMHSYLTGPAGGPSTDQNPGNVDKKSGNIISQHRTMILPKGLTVSRAISDYLKKMGEFAIATVQRSSQELRLITNEDVQWCLTVPGIWTEKAKRLMKTCAETAGLVRGPTYSQLQGQQSASPHEVIILLEAEAASVYCQQNLSKNIELTIKKGAKLLVVDIGGSTVDMVLHEKMDGLKTKEVSPADGVLCGGIFVDEAFFKFLAARIDCLDELGREYPAAILDLRKSWETVKHSFGKRTGATANSIDDGSFEIEIPARLSRAWQAHDGHRGVTVDDPLHYEVIKLTQEDLEGIFDPTVKQILQAIERKCIKGLAAIMVVGGFSSSPYLQKKIQQKFRSKVGAIITPDEPGCAVLCGAVAFGTQPGVDIIMSRISRKTFGIDIVRPFRSYDPIELKTVDHKGQAICTNVFEAVVRKGDNVPCNHQVDLPLEAWHSGQKKMIVGLYSTDCKDEDEDNDPMYITDTGVKKEGYFVINHPAKADLGSMARLQLSVNFGQTTIQVTGEGSNFRKGKTFRMCSVSFETGCEEANDDNIVIF